MRKTRTDTTESSGTAVILTGDAIAVGEDTLTSVTSTLSVDIKSTGKTMVKAKGEITAVAVADSTESDTFTYAFTDAYSTEATKVKIKTTEASFEEDGVSYSYSYTSTKVWDRDTDKEATFSYKTKTKDDIDVDVDLEGNLALVDVATTAEGPASLAEADLYALTLEDMLSQSSVQTIAAVHW